MHEVALPEGRARRVVRHPEVRAVQRELVGHLREARDSAGTELVLDFLDRKICRHDDGALFFVPPIDQGIKLFEHPVGLPLGSQIVQLEQGGDTPRSMNLVSREKAEFSVMTGSDKS